MLSEIRQQVKQNTLLLKSLKVRQQQQVNVDIDISEDFRLPMESEADVTAVEETLQDKEKSKVKFRVYGRERFPTRTYSTSSQNLTVKFIPSQSQYSVRDALSEDEIIPFSTGSYLSCDGAGNYFRLDLNAFQPERHYRFLYKVVSGSGNTRVEHILDEDHIFKVTR